jgi:hypothetical protein
MPLKKKPLTLQAATAKVYVEIYCEKCERWLLDLLAALHDVESAYLLVVNTVMDECRQIANELLSIAPSNLKLLSPRLALEFGKMIRNYDVSARMMHHIFRCTRGHLPLCTAVFRSVLSGSIERFDALLTTQNFLQLIIVRTLDSVPNLLELTLSRLFVDQSALLASKIHHLTNLQIFKYRCYCTDVIVIMLGMHCPHLTEVDISASPGITNASVQHLMQLKKLKFLNVEGTQIDDEHYAMVLLEVTNIASISLWQNDVNILRHITVERLNTITHINGSFLDVNTLANKCPNTTNISLTTDRIDLWGLTAFNALRVLSFNDLDYGMCNMTIIMRRIGDRLTDLSMFGAKRVNLRDILTLCRFLENLSFLCSSYLRPSRPYDPQLPHFRHLIGLRIDIFSREASTFSFIRYYVNVKTLHLRNINIFTVHFVKEILKLGTLQELEVLQLQEYFPGAVTIEALRMLIGHCTFLECIAGLRRCPRLNPQLINLLKEEIKSNNFHLEIED